MPPPVVADDGIDFSGDDFIAGHSLSGLFVTARRHRRDESRIVCRRLVTRTPTVFLSAPIAAAPVITDDGPRFCAADFNASPAAAPVFALIIRPGVLRIARSTSIPVPATTGPRPAAPPVCDSSRPAPVSRVVMPVQNSPRFKKLRRPSSVPSSLRSRSRIKRSA